MEIVDLSKEIYSGMEIFQGDPEVRVTVVQDYEKHSWQVRELHLGSHSGSHVDSFSHMHKGMDTIDKIPLERFFGKCQLLKIDDQFPKGIGLLFNEAIDEKILEKILIARPNFVGANMSEELERKLLINNIITYTDLINLDQLPLNTTFMFYGLPLKISGGDGSPTRAIAIID